MYMLRRSRVLYLGICAPLAVAAALGIMERGSCCGRVRQQSVWFLQPYRDVTHSLTSLLPCRSTQLVKLRMEDGKLIMPQALNSDSVLPL